MCIDESQHPTAYVIQKGHQKMGLHVSVDSFHDWCMEMQKSYLGSVILLQHMRKVLADEKAGKIQRQLPLATAYR